MFDKEAAPGTSPAKWPSLSLSQAKQAIALPIGKCSVSQKNFD